jgi:predicted cobalt transporter CbtA
MRTIALGASVKAALLAGLVAALLTAGIHFVVTEPVIEQAISLEEIHNQAMGMPEEDPVVSRDVQRGGLFLGVLIYGLTFALLLGGVFYLAQRRLPGDTLWMRGIVLCALAYWSLSLLPFLKYPANPPAVGDPETITYRQSLYLGMLLLNVLGAALAIWLGSRRGWLVGGIALAVYSVVVYLALPGNPDAVTIPEDLLMAFRGRSLLGLTLFWGLVAAIFGHLLNRYEKGIRARQASAGEPGARNTAAHDSLPISEIRASSL